MLLGKEKVWWLFFILQEDSHVQNVRSFPEEESSLDSVSRSDGRTAANKEKQMWGTLRFLAANSDIKCDKLFSQIQG